jgi:methylthioribose-1-phosphate isomerase
MFSQSVPTLCRDGDGIVILDQTALPWKCETRRLATLEEVARAISTMQVRGAPLIGCTAAHGVAIALSADASEARLDHALAVLRGTRPTAINLSWALERMAAKLRPLPENQRAAASWTEAAAIAAEDAAACEAIGAHGLALLRSRPLRAGVPLRIMTHCNAGRLATLGTGTALAPIYAAHAAGFDIEVTVSETRPRNQGLLTAWELRTAGLTHRLIADNAAGLLLAQGEIDMVLTGADRIAANGDTVNKTGTYLKALAAHANGVPFYVAAPRASIDFSAASGAAIPIEERGMEEVLHTCGLDEHGAPRRLALAPPGTLAANPAFDLTPAPLITGFITERGVFSADELREALA